MSYLLSDEADTKIPKSTKQRTLWRAPTNKTNYSISNGWSIQKVKTLTSYHLWIRRNMIILNETDEYIYVSGQNLVFEIYEKQKYIPIKSDWIVTSIYHQKSSTNENLHFIGEKISPNEDRK